MLKKEKTKTNQQTLFKFYLICIYACATSQSHLPQAQYKFCCFQRFYFLLSGWLVAKINHIMPLCTKQF